MVGVIEKGALLLTQRTHELKILPQYFDAVNTGAKPFEVRRNDRGYQVDDILILREYDGVKYTGRKVKRTVSYMLKDTQFLQEGYVVLGLGQEG